MHENKSLFTQQHSQGGYFKWNCSSQEQEDAGTSFLPAKSLHGKTIWRWAAPANPSPQTQLLAEWSKLQSASLPKNINLLITAWFKHWNFHCLRSPEVNRRQVLIVGQFIWVTVMTLQWAVKKNQDALWLSLSRGCSCPLSLLFLVINVQLPRSSHVLPTKPEMSTASTLKFCEGYSLSFLSVYLGGVKKGKVDFTCGFLLPLSKKGWYENCAAEVYVPQTVI